MARGGGTRGLATSVMIGVLSVAGIASAEANASDASSKLYPAQMLATISYGVALEGEHEPWAFGVGLLTGYTLPEDLFVGLEVDYFFGGEASGPGHETAFLPVKVNYFEPMLQVGYDWSLTDHWFLRPGLGAGVAMLRHRACRYESDGIGSELTLVDCDRKHAVDAVVSPGIAFVFRHFITAVWRLRYDVVFTDYELAGMYDVSFPMRGVIGTFGIGY